MKISNMAANFPPQHSDLCATLENIRTVRGRTERNESFRAACLKEASNVKNNVTKQEIPEKVRLKLGTPKALKRVKDQEHVRCLPMSPQAVGFACKPGTGAYAPSSPTIVGFGQCNTSTPVPILGPLKCASGSDVRYNSTPGLRKGLPVSNLASELGHAARMGPQSDVLYTSTPGPRKGPLPMSSLAEEFGLTSTPGPRKGPLPMSSLAEEFGLTSTPGPLSRLIHSNPLTSKSDSHLTSTPGPRIDKANCNSSFFTSHPLCRICYEDDSSEILISPCHCAGTMGMLHMSCLEQWLGTSDTTKCEICQFQFSVKRRPRSLRWYFQNKELKQDRQILKRSGICCLVMTFVLAAMVTGCILGVQQYSMQNQPLGSTGLLILLTVFAIFYIILTVYLLRRNWLLCREWKENYQVIKIKHSLLEGDEVDQHAMTPVNSRANLFNSLKKQNLDHSSSVSQHSQKSQCSSRGISISNTSSNSSAHNGVQFRPVNLEDTDSSDEELCHTIADITHLPNPQSLSSTNRCESLTNCCQDLPNEQSCDSEISSTLPDDISHIHSVSSSDDGDIYPYPQRAEIHGFQHISITRISSTHSLAFDEASRCRGHPMTFHDADRCRGRAQSLMFIDDLDLHKSRETVV